VAIPVVPNIDTRRNPREEQLAHVLESTLRAEPENKDVRLDLTTEFLNTYKFILTTIPKNIEVKVERIKPRIASSGK